MHMHAHLSHIFISMLVVISCLIVVIGIHELGHALAARLFHIRIERIALGFGKTLKRWTCRSGCTIELNWCLIGGRVFLLNSRLGPVADDKFIYCFDKKPIWVRTMILIAGSFANFVTASLALCFMMMIGFKEIAPVIGSVTPSSPAAIADLQAGDHITQVANHPTLFWRDVGMQFIMNMGKSQVPITTCSETNPCKTSIIDLRLWTKKTVKGSLFEALGIMPDQSSRHEIEVKGLTLGAALHSGLMQFGQLTWFFMVMVKQILASNIPFAALLGPFQLFKTIIASFFQGIAIFLYFMANFSIAMGLVNLLPLPSLDGGSIIYAWIEKVRGQPISIALELLLYRLFFIVMVLLFFQLIMNDLRSYHLL